MSNRLRAARHYAGFAVTFLVQLVLSAWDVAKAVLTREPRFKSAILAVPLEVKTDAEISVLANVVSLTPGTTSLHVSEDREVLYIHVLDARDPDKVIADIKEQFESKLVRAAA